MEMDPTLLLPNDPASRNGHRRLRATLGTLAYLVIVPLASLLVSSSASAATLIVVGGQLLGASDVDVGGGFYDVEFLDGTCIALFNGCDDDSDFTFQSQAEATAASQALLDQVFLDGADLFDSDPRLTNGCSSGVVCTAVTVFDVNPFAANVMFANNLRAGRTPDSVALREGFSFSQDTTDFPGTTYAVWTPVPEPGTAVLLGLGLLALSGRKRHEGSVFDSDSRRPCA